MKRVQPKPGKHPWGWRDPVFRHDYLLFVCPAAALSRWLKDHCGQEVEVKSDAVAYTMYVGNNVVGIWFNSERQAPPKEWAAYVSHEAEHATRFVMGTAGVPHTPESDEAWAYYLCWVVEEITDRLRFR